MEFLGVGMGPCTRRSSTTTTKSSNSSSSTKSSNSSSTKYSSSSRVGAWGAKCVPALHPGLHQAGIPKPQLPTNCSPLLRQVGAENYMLVEFRWTALCMRRGCCDIACLAAS